MRLFKKPDQPAEPTGRRRPVAPEVSRPQAFSYYAGRSGAEPTHRRPVPQSQAQEASERLQNARKPLVMLVVAAVVVIVGYATWLSGTPQIDLAVVSNTKNAYALHSVQDYQASASKTLDSSLFNHNKLTVDSASVVRDLLNNYPEIQTASVTIPVIGHVPVVHIQPYKPAFIVTTAYDAAYVVDSGGRAVVSVSQVPDISVLHLRTIQDKSGLHITEGQQALSSGTISFTQTILNLLSAAHLSVNDLILPPASSELDVYMQGAPYFIKYNLQSDPKLQTGTYLAAIGRLQKDHTVPSQYIDVRVPGRVYYR